LKGKLETNERKIDLTPITLSTQSEKLISDIAYLHATEPTQPMLPMVASLLGRVPAYLFYTGVILAIVFAWLTYALLFLHLDLGSYASSAPLVLVALFVDVGMAIRETFPQKPPSQSKESVP
jgi:hypothetical protein